MVSELTATVSVGQSILYRDISYLTFGNKQNVGIKKFSVFALGFAFC